MNHQRLQVVILAKAIHRIALALGQGIRLPLPWTRREDLKRIATQTVSSRGGVLYSASNRSVNADSPRGHQRRVLGHWPFQRIFFVWVKLERAELGHIQILELSQDVAPQNRQIRGSVCTPMDFGAIIHGIGGFLCASLAFFRCRRCCQYASRPLSHSLRQTIVRPTRTLLRSLHWTV